MDERYQIVDDNFGGPLVQIRNNATGEENWCRRSRLRRIDGAWMILTDRQYDLLMATRKKQAAKSRTKNEVATQDRVYGTAHEG
ncbi:MAG: hypothetical protein WB680_23185 [Candidatus Acidiferrales bacterium]